MRNNRKGMGIMQKSKQWMGRRLAGWLWMAAGGCVLAACTAWSEPVWEEDWASLDEWSIYEGPLVKGYYAGEAGEGTFGVSNANTWAHFLSANRVAVDVQRLKEYAVFFEVVEVSRSMSYQLDLDAFDANGEYLRTITVLPQRDDKKLWVIKLNSVPKADWKDVSQVAPKIGLSTGKGDQRMKVRVFKIEDAKL